MPTGIELYARDGTVTMTMTDRIFKVIGVVTLPANGSGNISVPEYNNSLNVPAYVVRPPDGQTFASNFVPGISISGTTLTWNSVSIRGMSPPRTVVLEYGYF